MSINIVVAPEFARFVQPARLRQLARKSLRAENRVSVSASLSIVILDDQEMQGYNRRFHSSDTPTDVLSFPSLQNDYLGDVIISYEQARDNARRAGWRVRDELELLVVHGVLHLLGYDDTTRAAREQMWMRQQAILGKDIR